MSTSPDLTAVDGAAPVAAPARLRHPVVELLARHLQVLRAAWGLRKELDGAKRLPHEAQFLPDRLALQETPPHPAPRWAALAIAAFFLLALGWSILAEIDVVATATGRLVVNDHTKLVQPLEPGIVRAIHVREGSHVQAGDLLIELDATAPGADGDTVRAERAAAEREMQSTSALLAALASGNLQFAQLSPTATAVAQAEWADIRARQAQLTAEAAQRQAELGTNSEAIAKLQATVPLARQREADMQALQAQGFVAGHASQDRTRERIELESDLATLRARRAETEAALAERQQARATHLAETRRTLNERLAQAREKLAQLAPQATKAEQRQRMARLVAPVAGTVQQLAIHTEGGVVTEAQPLMVIVPDDAALSAEVTLENKDIGFVQSGQEAAIKLETFNFTRYGTVPAVVSQVSADAVIDEKRGPLYTVTLSLNSKHMRVDGKAVPLAPGMTLSVEIKTGKRRVIEYLMSPLQQTANESLRER
ncbi:HlyD family type I secretion periplasmic adaptor subunit [Ideonella sp.]|uniref:HlyD family type I secretion periplasmic adaptor subunit n=1 Tax=Ideonella sp. TaxID=1929293 RepID=UPI0035B13010